MKSQLKESLLGHEGGHKVEEDSHGHGHGHKEKEIGMATIGYTQEFPRRDNIYKHKESLPFDESQAEIWIQRPSGGTRE
jgi:hypothetical protein